MMRILALPTGEEFSAGSGRPGRGQNKSSKGVLMVKNESWIRPGRASADSRLARARDWGRMRPFCRLMHDL